MRGATLTRWACATVVMAGLIAAAVASAHTESYKSTVTIKHEDESPKYSGRVISALEACERNRTVKLYTSEGQAIAETTTNDRGHWKYEFIGAQYYARVVRRVIGSGQHEHICKADRSPTTPT